MTATGRPKSDDAQVKSIGAPVASCDPRVTFHFQPSTYLGDLKSEGWRQGTPTTSVSGLVEVSEYGYSYRYVVKDIQSCLRSTIFHISWAVDTSAYSSLECSILSAVDTLLEAPRSIQYHRHPGIPKYLQYHYPSWRFSKMLKRSHGAGASEGCL